VKTVTLPSETILIVCKSPENGQEKVTWQHTPFCSWTCWFCYPKGLRVQSLGWCLTLE